MKTVFLLLALVLPFGVTAVAQAPVQTRHPGVVLFEQAKFPEAIRSLEVASKSKEHKTDAEIWNYLGLAYLAKDEAKKSRKAFEQSVKLDPGSSVFHANLGYAYLMNGQINKAQQSADKALALNPKNPQAYQVRGLANFWEAKLDPAERDADSFIQLQPGDADAYLLKSEILLAKLGIRVGAGHAFRGEVGFLKRAIDALNAGIANAKTHPRYSELERELQSLTVFSEHFSRDPSSTPITAPRSTDAGVTPFRILSKPRASYTDRARSALISGTVQVKVLLGTNGKVEHVLLIKRLGFGLDQEAIKAAKKIKFEPKMINGKPVPVVVTIEYGFTIY